MKTSKLLMLLFVMAAFLFSGSIYAQNVGIAADKQKQENLEKNKKRQAELKKKYDAMTPEQKAAAKKKADAYKTGGKTTSNPTKPATLPAASNPNKRAVQVHQSKPRSNKPVWMDPNGHAKTTPAPAKPAEKDVKPAAESKTKPSTPPAKPGAKPAAPPAKNKSEIKVK